MEPNDFEEFGKSFMVLAEIHGKELSHSSVLAYFQALASYPIKDVKNALSSAITTLKFFPKPSELIEFCNCSGGKVEDLAIVQAGSVLNAIKRIGRYQTVRFSDPVTAAVIKTHFGGWAKLCNEQKSENENWFLKDFADAYRAYAKQGKKCFEALPGVIEIENSANGLVYDLNKLPNFESIAEISFKDTV